MKKLLSVYEILHKNNTKKYQLHMELGVLVISNLNKELMKAECHW